MDVTKPEPMTTATDPTSPLGPPPRSRRVWAFRLMAVLLALSIFVLFEGLCRLVGWGVPSEHDDPYVGFDEVRPLFLPNEEAGEYRISPSRRRFFADESFPLTKDPGVRRVFVLGGSTVQGRPYSIPTSFPTFLELGLSAADPDVEWQVVNCGGISYASYRLIPILEECLRYEPDLFIVCTGHNEFLEDRTYGHLRETSPLLRWASSLRTVVMLRSALGRDFESTAERPVLPPDTDPILDYEDGLALYHRDDEWRKGVVAHFEFNLHRLAEIARDAEVPLMFVRPVSDLRDTRPFKSELRSDLTEEERTAFHRLLRDARQRYGRSPEEATRFLDEALEIDDGYADAWYEYGELREALGQLVEAREAYVAARDTDVCPLRMISPLEEVLARVAEEERVRLFDAFAFLEADCPEGILDGSQLVDHVHPSIEGHRRIANALVEFLAEEGRIDPVDGWLTVATTAQRAHIGDLDELYFLHGQRTLDSVRAWTQGRADGPSAHDRFPER